MGIFRMRRRREQKEKGDLPSLEGRIALRTIQLKILHKRLFGKNIRLTTPETRKKKIGYLGWLTQRVRVLSNALIEQSTRTTQKPSRLARFKRFFRWGRVHA